MRQAELTQLEHLSRIDRLIARCRDWPREPVDWEPGRQGRHFLQAVFPRVEQMRERLETPLVVALFGGTGTGKSSLVNALLGQEVARSGRERPTTLRPQLLIHPEINVELLHLPLEDCDLQRPALALLEDLIIVDCPDPDTTEQAPGGDEATESNLDRLRKFLPHCDVLIYTSTQQKYRSANVQKELRDAAAGCRLVFVQTHADRDVDIREDWQAQLRGEYEIPEMFFVDSRASLKRQQEGLPAEGEMARLQNFLLQQLGSSHRSRIRRDNVLDLLYATLSRTQQILQARQPALKELRTELTRQTRQVQQRLSEGLQQDLLAARQLWERRLVEAVVNRWGSTPFSWLLRLYCSLGTLLGSFGLMRARTTAHVALLGLAQGLRAWKQYRQESEFQSAVSELDELPLAELDLVGQRLVLQGYARAAGFSAATGGRESAGSHRVGTAFQAEFFQDARREVDQAVDRLATRNSGPLIRTSYDLLFLVFPLFLLGRIGKNFFWDSLFGSTAILAADFYLPAAIFLGLWCGLFVMLFVRRLRRGLRQEVRQLVERIVSHQFQHDLFPEWQQQCVAAEAEIEDLHHLIEECHALRIEQETHSLLGAARVIPQPEPVRDGRW